MRRLLLLRHAKSSWDNVGLDDFERPLSGRGRRAATEMASYLLENDLIPAQVVCSPARRAAETWEHISPVLGGMVPVEFEPGLYMASASAILGVAQSQPVENETVLVVGHNPGIEATAVGLTGTADAGVLDEMRMKYPTAGLAVLEFDSDVWGEIDWESGTLERFVRPRDL